MEQIEPRRLSSAEAAEYVGIGASTLNKRRVFGGGPAYRKLGRRVTYDTRDLDAWLELHRRTSTSDAPINGTGQVAPAKRPKVRRRRA